MLRSFVFAAVFVALVVPAAAFADAGPTVTGKPNVAEATFLHTIQANLNARFASAADAERAGYARYTNEDETGSISYANRAWESADPKHPSQLWYDASGHLLGADFSTKKTNVRPNKWGVQPGRWASFDAHVHYVTVDPATGKKTYDLAVSTAKFTGAGGNLAAPTAAPLVKLGLVKSASQVSLVFLFPSIWDLTVWVKPNPDGAFADKNPLVTPSTTH